VTVVSFPDALQLCQRCVGLLKTDTRICVEGSQQAVLCVQLENSSVDLTKLGNLRRRTRHREVIWIICSSLTPEGSNVGQGGYVLVESSWTSVILRYIFSVSPLAQRLESSNGYTTLTSRLCLAISLLL
jgi:hypothetical protein